MSSGFNKRQMYALVPVTCREQAPHPLLPLELCPWKKSKWTFLPHLGRSAGPFALSPEPLASAAWLPVLHFLLGGWTLLLDSFTSFLGIQFLHMVTSGPLKPVRLGITMQMLRSLRRGLWSCVAYTHPPMDFTSPLDGLLNPIQCKYYMSLDYIWIIDDPSNVSVLKITLLHCWKLAEPIRLGA